MARLRDAVPLTTADLTGFAGALFDHLRASPKLLRLGTWGQLDGAGSPIAEIAQFREKIEAIAQAQKQGVITTDLEPDDLLVLSPLVHDGRVDSSETSRSSRAEVLITSGTQPTTRTGPVVVVF